MAQRPVEIWIPPSDQERKRLRALLDGFETRHRLALDRLVEVFVDAEANLVESAGCTDWGGDCAAWQILADR